MSVENGCNYCKSCDICDNKGCLVNKQKIEIERLHKELSDVYENRVEICKQLAEQKAELERLTEENAKLKKKNFEQDVKICKLDFRNRSDYDIL